MFFDRIREARVKKRSRSISKTFWTSRSFSVDLHHYFLRNSLYQKSRNTNRSQTCKRKRTSNSSFNRKTSDYKTHHPLRNSLTLKLTKRAMSSKSSPQKRTKRISKEAKAPKASTMDETYVTGVNGGAVRRIRTPHPHDVLSGRGGGINSHGGNQTFREWVRVRKDDYNLAPSKNDKARVAREVVALVEEQVPPGRFLSKDPTAIGSSSWWVELDDERVMAKTSQALREGAPSIRAAHKHDVPEDGVKEAGRRNRKQTPRPLKNEPNLVEDNESLSAGSKRKYSHDLSQDDALAAQQLSSEQAIDELRANVEAARHDNDIYKDFGCPEKRVRVDYKGHTVYPTDETPPLLPTSVPSHMEPIGHAMLPPPAELPQRPYNGNDGLKRANSLAFSEVNLGEWQDDDFVNPFEDESELEWHKKNTPPSPSPKSGLMRETSMSSNGDMGGIGALMRQESFTKSGSNGSAVGNNGALMRLESFSKSGSSGSSGVRSKNIVGNMSNRYEDSDEHARNLLFHEEGWSSTPSYWWNLEEPPTSVSPDRDSPETVN
jgi:hypothetical protein